MNRIDRYLNGTLSPDEAREFSRAILEDPALADELAEATRLDENLRSLMHEAGRGRLFVRRFERAERELTSRPPRRTLSLRILRPAAAAAVIAAVLTAGYFVRKENRPVFTREMERRVRVEEPWESTATEPVIGGQENQGLATSEMKRKLENFFVPVPGMSASPVSAVLTALENQWHALPHRNAEEGRVVRFAIAEDVREAWNAAGEEPLVSVDIPGVSMMTCLDLVAAQAGLRVTPTETGAILTTDGASVPPGERTWTFPISSAELAACSQRIRQAERSGPFEPGREILLDIAPEITGIEGTVAVPAFSSDQVDSDLLITGIETNAGESAGFVVDEDRQVPGEEPGKFYKLYQVNSLSAMAPALEKYGINPSLLTYDETSQILTARGTVPDLRKAAAFLAATRQSATSGISIEGGVVRLNTDPVRDSAGMYDVEPVPAAEYQTQWREVCRSPHAREVATISNHGTSPDTPVTLEATGGSSSTTVIAATREGELIRLSVEVKSPRDGGASTRTGAFSVSPGDWIRINLPDETKFLRVRPATFTPGG